MAKTLHLVKNSKRVPCSNCGTVHDHLTLISKDAPCSTPAAFSREVAQNMSRLHANGHEDVETMTDDTFVVLHESARQLPKRHPPVLAQHTLIERMQ